MTTALTLPEETQLASDIAAIHRFQAMVRQTLKVDHDYGVIPGTQTPTLLKPGAEKITKLLGLADTYEIVDSVEDWDRPLFRYLIKCQLRGIANGQLVTEGLGECNSMESKYRWRWFWPAEAEKAGIDKETAATRTANTRNGAVTQYRGPNPDIYSQVNTILKMAKKRALVDAALSAGRLSEIFTQDIEDFADGPSSPPAATPRRGNGGRRPNGRSGQQRRPREHQRPSSAGNEPDLESGELLGLPVGHAGDLLTLALQHFGLSRSQTLAALGLKERSRIDDPAGLWAALVAIQLNDDEGDLEDEQSGEDTVANQEEGVASIQDFFALADTVRNVPDLYALAEQYFGLTPIEVIKELGYQNALGIGDPGEEWQRIVAVRKDSIDDASQAAETAGERAPETE